MVESIVIFGNEDEDRTGGGASAMGDEGVDVAKRLYIRTKR